MQALGIRYTVTSSMQLIDPVISENMESYQLICCRLAFLCNEKILHKAKIFLKNNNYKQNVVVARNILCSTNIQPPELLLLSLCIAQNWNIFIHFQSA